MINTQIKEPNIKHVKHQGLGNLQTWEKNVTGITGKSTNGYFKVTVYSASILRVHISQNKCFDELSYAVIGAPEDTEFSSTESTDEITIETELIKLKINKHSVRFSFYDHQDRVLNEDDSGFGVSFMSEYKTVYKTLQEGERFIGLGEKTGNLDRRGQGYTNYNTDSFAYGPGSDPLYCTIPFYIGLHKQLAYGIFLDNTYQSHFNFGASNDRFSSFSVNGGDLNYYFIHDSSVSGIISGYTHLTGRMPMPPLWGLGYQQCRYSYYPDHEVYQLAQTFREKQIPADAIVLDIHYMDQYKIFTWDQQRFPNPDKMVKDLKKQGYNIVVMCDPGIKVEEDYRAYEEGIAKDLFLKYPDGTFYTGQVWPGWCHFPDFTKPEVRQWWGEMMNVYVQQGIKGFWNDMNEIATWGQKLPELIEFDFEGEGGTTRRGRNIYGLMMCKSTYEGVKKLLGDERPFNLTRSAFSGVQRYSTVWTGDNVSSDEHMLLGVRLVNSLGLSGIAYAGYDVGGFVGEASTGLFARWISIGAFSPFFRGHSMVNSKDSEPWSYGEEVEDISRNYINLRYQMIPYLYSVFHEAATTGMPISRTLAIDFPFDDNVYQTAYQNQYLFGPSILVAPVESYKDIAKVYLPAGIWYNFHSDDIYQGSSAVYVDSPLTRLPLFVKAGSIIPMQNIVQTTQESPEPVLHLHIYDGDNSEFIYYEDDGISYKYEKGISYRRSIIFNHSDRTLMFSEVTGSWDSKFKEIKLYLHGFEEINSFGLDGSDQPLAAEEAVFLPPISNFDPLGIENQVDGIPVRTAVIENSNQQIKLNF